MNQTHPTSSKPSTDPAEAMAYIKLPICVFSERPDGTSLSELHLIRDALQFYSEHLRSEGEGQQNEDILIDVSHLEDILENLTQAAFDALDKRSRLLSQQG